MENYKDIIDFSALTQWLHDSMNNLWPGYEWLTTTIECVLVAVKGLSEG